MDFSNNYVTRAFPRILFCTILHSSGMIKKEDVRCRRVVTFRRILGVFKMHSSNLARTVIVVGR